MIENEEYQCFLSRERQPSHINNCCSASVQWPALADSDLSGQLPVELYECQGIAVKENACSVDFPCINKCLTRLKVYSPASTPPEAMWFIIPNTMLRFCQMLPLLEPHQYQYGKKCEICPEGNTTDHTNLKSKGFISLGMGLCSWKSTTYIAK